MDDHAEECAAPAGFVGVEALLQDFVSRLDAEQAVAFRRKMAELDAERRRCH